MSNESAWYAMGMRDGNFCGVNPATFLNTAYRFFLTLKTSCRKAVTPEYRPSDAEESFSFNGLAKSREYLDWEYYSTKERFSYDRAPLGAPFAPEKWEDPHPLWDAEVLERTRDDVLGEESFTHGPHDTYTRGFIFDLQFQKQLYKLIQKFRFSIIPLEVSYLGNDGKWHEWFGNTGCVNLTCYWSSYKRWKVRIPEYFRKEQALCKIGVYAKNQSPGYRVPIDGSFWNESYEYTTPAVSSTGWSTLRIYGAIDLSTHPDFKKYIDIFDSPEES